MTATVLFGLLLASLGLGLTPLSMSRHYRSLGWQMPSKGSSQRALRWSGWLLLAISVWLCVSFSGVGLGLVWWAGWLTLSAVVFSLFLTYRPGWFLPLVVLLGIAIILTLVSMFLAQP
ncbi:DUF3325 domain-containing protein [Thalassolituus maritimus]|uniref:DUF3325 domain-containing protein n=1 Tax=Thalassolituus maritimus TaxID=484498 RepID=A0ABP9ZXE5_9GAMM